MRNRLLGTLAALTAGAGVAFAQSPSVGLPPPTSVGVYGGDLQLAGGPAVGEIIPPPVGYGGPGMMPGPMDGPGYPPGIPGQRPWESAFEQSNVASAASRAYLDTQFLLWFVKAQPVNVPLVSSSAPQDQGLAGRPTTSLLHSRTDLGYNLFSGFNIQGGWFRDADRRHGIALGGMLFERKSNNFFLRSDATGIPVIARPFVDATTGGPGVLTVAQQGLASGDISVITTNRMYGAEGSLLTNLYRSCPEDCRKITINSTLGFRYFDIAEDLSIASRSQLLGGGAPRFNGAAIFPPSVVEVRDEFRTTNRFYGAQFGIQSQFESGKWNVGFNSKLAFGLMSQVIDVEGKSILVDVQRGVAAQALGGLYANSQNIGRTRNDEFAFIPEIGTSLGYNWSSWLTTGIGYNFMYINRVLRPGNAVTNVVNPTVLPTSQGFGAGNVGNVPNTLLNQDEFWAQGVTFHILMRY